MSVITQRPPARIRPAPGWPALAAAVVTALGVGLGFVIAEVARWCVRLIAATPFPVPQPIQVIAELPLVWTIPLLGALGVIGAVMVARAMVSECARFVIAGDHVEYRDQHGEGYLDRADIGGVFSDKGHLVVWDHRERPLLRTNADLLSAPRLRRAFTDHGYRWLGEGDPRENEYRRWLDGHPELTSKMHAVLRRRRDALKGKDHTAAAAAAAELAAGGVVVRDRGGVQQYRTLTAEVEHDDGTDGGPGPA